MKARDANDIAREAGPDALCAAFDEAQPEPGHHNVNGAARTDANDARNLALLARPIGIIDPRKISPRRFVYGRHLVRRYYSVTVSPSGIGKTTVVLTESVAMVTGRTLLHDRPHEGKLRVLYINAEDPADEIERRVAAILAFYNIPAEEIADGLFIMSGRDARLKLAECDPRTGAPLATPAVDLLRGEIARNRIDVLQLDPFSRMHLLSENNNDHVNFLADILTSTAEQTNIAIDVVHHTRKPATGQAGGGEGDANTSRGASALVDGGRSARTATGMSDADAAKFGLPSNKARWFIRLDNAKASMFPPATEARWLERESVHLPNGDDVGVLKIWTPPDVWDGMSPDKANMVLDAIEAGTGDGERFTASKRSPERWAGRLLMEMADRTEMQAGQILKAWLTASVPFLKEEEYPSPERRKQRRGLFVIGRPGAVT